MQESFDREFENNIFNAAMGLTTLDNAATTNVNQLFQRIVSRGGTEWYVYEGRCDDFITKYVTQGRWNGFIRVCFYEGELNYKDIEFRKMYVYEDDEPGYFYW